MNRLVSFLLLLLGIVPVGFAEEPTKPSPAVKRILDEAAREVRANTLAFHKANQKPLGNARRELQELSTKLIQDGKTAEAQAVLKQVETLEADVVRMASSPLPAAGRAGLRPSLLSALEGKWDLHEGKAEHLILTRDGRATLHRNSDGSVFVTGALTQASSDIAEIRWDNGFRWQIRMANGDALTVVEIHETDGGRRRSLSPVRMK